MDASWLHMTPQDWIALGLIALVPLLMAVAICLIRSEVKQVARHTPIVRPKSEPPPLRLKTTEVQREQRRRENSGTRARSSIWRTTSRRS